MDLNHLQLPATVIADLYPASLIETGELSFPANELASSKTGNIHVHEEAPSKTFRWLGENKKNILIAVNYADAVHLPDAALQLLTSILGACQLSLADVAVLNLSSQPSKEYAAVNTYFKPRIALLFDVEPAAFGLPMNFPFFQLQAFARTTFLYAPPLQQLESDKVLKSKLWVSLKRLFNL